MTQVNAVAATVAAPIGEPGRVASLTPRMVKPDLTPPLPQIIQGGMGVGISGWQLARAVAQAGQLGVVSGVALDALLSRRLQAGDPGGHIRRALAHFPVPAIALRVLERHFIPGGKEEAKPFRPIHRNGLRPSRPAAELAMVANFVEVFLAKDGHDGVVGMNFLEKMQLASPAAVFGAMLAGVDFVLMGAGLPTEIPRLLNALAANSPAELTVTVAGVAAGEKHSTCIDPDDLLDGARPPVSRPRFLAIVSTAALAAYLARDPATCPDGFVLETPVAGGHSARPRGRFDMTDDGEPIYGPRDDLGVARVAPLGLPFWLAGGYCGPQRLAEARAQGAAGIQVGSAFALCRESGLDPTLRRRLLDDADRDGLVIRNRLNASPTGFPFKVVDLVGSVSGDDVYALRPRHCDLGYLRTPYRKATGDVGYRCPAEPVDAFVRKGGSVDDTTEARCLCNGLVATTGLGQRRADGYSEPPLVTLGQDLSFLDDLRPADGTDYSATDVIDYILGATHPVSVLCGCKSEALPQQSKSHCATA